MLAIETGIAYARPQTTATGRTAKTYTTPRLSTGTYGLASAMAAVTRATAPALARTPTTISARRVTGETVMPLRARRADAFTCAKGSAEGQPKVRARSSAE